MSATYLVTGPTGLLGRWLVRALLRKRPDVRLALLVRAPDEALAAQRCAALLAGGLEGPENFSRITPICGDVARSSLGISPADYDRLVHSIDGVFHCAASVRFDSTRAEAETINLQGAAQVLDLLCKVRAAGRAVQLHHVSTAFVAGCRTGRYREADPPETRCFFNEYERSKALAEQMVRAAGSEFPVTIYRPSQIVGDSQTGEVVNPGLLYSVVKYCFRGNRLTLPRAKGVAFDLVPVDYAADALEYISRQPAAAGRTFHLVAGPTQAVSIEEFVRLIRETANELRREQGLPALPGPRWIAPFRLRLLLWFSRLTPKGRKTAKIARPILEYLTLSRVYDDENARELLGAAGLQPPAVKDYAGIVFGKFLREWSTAKA